MWRTMIQVCSGELSVRVALEARMLDSGMVSAKLSYVLGETWVSQLRRCWAETSQVFSPWRLRSLKPEIATSFILPTMVSR